MSDRYWIATDFGNIPVPFSAVTRAADEPILNRVGRNLKPAKIQAMRDAQEAWSAGVTFQ